MYQLDNLLSYLHRFERMQGEVRGSLLVRGMKMADVNLSPRDLLDIEPTSEYTLAPDDPEQHWSLRNLRFQDNDLFTSATRDGRWIKAPAAFAKEGVHIWRLYDPRVYVRIIGRVLTKIIHESVEQGKVELTLYYPLEPVARGILKMPAYAVTPLTWIHGEEYYSTFAIRDQELELRINTARTHEPAIVRYAGQTLPGLSALEAHRVRSWIARLLG